VSEALSIVLGEIERIRSEKVSDEELSTARNYAVGIFPRFFATAQIVASTFASDEFTGRDPGFWKSYCDAMRAVTADDVLRVAREQLRPERLVVLLVGKGDDILKADRSGTIAKLSGAEGPRPIPLPEPLELRYPSK
jgi:zinc protease